MSQTAIHDARSISTDAEYDVELRQVSKMFNGEPVVRNVDLKIHRGEFFSILGPSGCGKTTTLRMIGGFETPSVGEVLICGQLMTQTPPYRRPVNTVFQSYALFNHLTVWENVAFGLKLKKLGRGDIQEQVDQVLQLVKMDALAKRFPGQLSGGQQQRVALARALVNRPEVVLLDEPLGALDFKLRKEMQVELATLQRELGLTFVMVTHDQEEALSLSDRIAVMNQGLVEQIGTPAQIYEQPRTAFVANFIGDTNLFHGKIEGTHPAMLWVVSEQGLRMKVKTSETGDVPTSGFVKVSVRPEKIQISLTEPPEGVNCFMGRLQDVMYLGTHLNYLVRLDSGDLVRVTQSTAGLAVPDADTPLYVHWAASDCLAIAVYGDHGLM